MYDRPDNHQDTDQNLTEAVRRAIEHEQRLAFVESVFAVLSDPGRTCKGSVAVVMTPDVNKWLAVDDALLSPNADGGSVVFTFLPYSRTACGDPLLTFRDEPERLRRDRLSPAYLGGRSALLWALARPRGSPESFGTHETGQYHLR